MQNYMAVGGTKKNGHRMAVFAVFILLFTITLVSCCHDVTEAATDYKLNKTSLTMDLYDTFQLEITPDPTTSTMSVTWSSSKEDVATVENGEVYAASKGSATITAIIKNGDTTVKELKCSVSVRVGVESVSLDKTKMTLAPGESQNLTVTVRPNDAYDKSVTWSSNNKGVAEVDSNGKVTAKSTGTAEISVTSNDNGLSAKCTVTVATVKVSSVSITNPPTSIDVNGSATLTATVLPSNATNKSVTWSSSNPDVISVSSSGVIKGVAPGTAKITVTTVDTDATGSHCKAECTIEAKVVATTGVELTPEEKTIEVDEQLTMRAKVLPENASYKGVKWISGDPRIASVSDSGVVTGVSPGTVTIKVTTESGSFTDTAVIKVSSSYTLTLRPDANGDLKAEEISKIDSAASTASSKHLNLKVELESSSETVKFPSSVIDTIMKCGGNLQLTTRLGYIVIETDGLDNIDTSAKTAGFTLKSTALPEKFSSLNPATVINMEMLAGETPVETIFLPSDVTVVFNHALGTDEKKENLRVCYLNEYFDKPIQTAWSGYEDDAVWFGAYVLGTYAIVFHEADMGNGIDLVIIGALSAVAGILFVLCLLFLRTQDGFRELFHLKPKQPKEPKMPPQQPPYYNPYNNYR